MGTVLRWLVIMILVLSGSALFLAVKLYGKRELLINRTHLLEEQFRKVAKTIEAAEPAGTARPNYVAKDTTPVTSQDVESPERSTFWNSYQYKLETPNLPTMSLESAEKQRQLRSYYQTTKGPDGKEVKVKYPVNQTEYSTKGPGTMQDLLDQVLERATKQNVTLNKTRGELQKLREELAATIDDYNKIKQDARVDKKNVEDKSKEVAKLKDDIRALEPKISALADEKKVIVAEAAELKKDIENKQALIDDLNKQVKERDVALSKKPMTAEKKPSKETVTPAESFQGAPGDKGKIVAVDDNLKFVVVDLSDAAMTELVGEQRDRPMPQVEQMVRRPGFKSASGEFITRIKFRQVLRQKNLVVADILVDWQQSPVEVGDVVFF